MTDYSIIVKNCSLIYIYFYYKEYAVLRLLNQEYQLSLTIYCQRILRK